MSQLREEELLAFHDELKKSAALNARTLLGGAGAGAGVGALVGSVGGAVHGAIQGARKGREEGGMGGLAGGFTGAAGGAVRGAGYGAAAGALGGAGVAAVRPNAIGSLVARDGALGAGARFGQRQVHALTGWTPKGGIESIRGGAYDARQALQSAKPKDLPQASKALQSAEAAQSMGLTSLPGYAKALQQHGAKKVLQTDASAVWHSGGLTGKALTIGLPAATLASDIRRPESAEGPGKGELIGRSIAGTAGGVLGTAMPIGGQIALGAGMGAVGGLVGRGVDRLRGRKRHPPGDLTPPEQQQSSHTPTERVMSPAAAGRPPEGVSA